MCIYNLCLSTKLQIKKKNLETKTKLKTDYPNIKKYLMIINFFNKETLQFPMFNDEKRYRYLIFYCIHLY